MMPNVLQYPVAIAGILRAGCTVVNVNPLYKPRELEFQLNDCRRRSDRRAGEFRLGAARGAAAHAVKHVVVASMGDMLGTVKGALVNLRGAPRQENGAGLCIAGRDEFNDALAPAAR